MLVSLIYYSKKMGGGANATFAPLATPLGVKLSTAIGNVPGELQSLTTIAIGALEV